MLIKATLSRVDLSYYLNITHKMQITYLMTKNLFLNL